MRVLHLIFCFSHWWCEICLWGSSTTPLYYTHRRIDEWKPPKYSIRTTPFATELSDTVKQTSWSHTVVGVLLEHFSTSFCRLRSLDQFRQASAGAKSEKLKIHGSGLQTTSKEHISVVYILNFNSYWKVRVFTFYLRKNRASPERNFTSVLP